MGFRRPSAPEPSGEAVARQSIIQATTGAAIGSQDTGEVLASPCPASLQVRLGSPDRVLYHGLWGPARRGTGEAWPRAATHITSIYRSCQEGFGGVREAIPEGIASVPRGLQASRAWNGRRPVNQNPRFTKLQHFLNRFSRKRRQNEHNGHYTYRGYSKKA